MKKLKFDLRFLYLFLPLLFLEGAFHGIQFTGIDLYTILRILLFTSFFSFFISLLFTKVFRGKKTYFIAGLIVIVLLCAYSFVELIFKNFMGDFYSFGTVSDGAARIAQYALIFLSNARPSYYLCLVPIVIYLLLHRFVRFNAEGPFQLPMIFCILSILLLIPIMDLGSGVNSILKVYGTFSNKDMIIDRMGITHFLFRDLSALYYKVPDTIEFEEEEQPMSAPDVEEDLMRTIDDSYWKQVAEAEDNSNKAGIDRYLMSRSITQPNEMTGTFEGYNFIYFMVEAMDYLSIDPELTPTLYQMYSEGLTFYNHYTPLYSCATGESEFVSYTSLFPYANTCTPNAVTQYHYYEALPYLFRNAGYETFALHNWRDEFYERKTLLPNLGFDAYYDIDDIWQDPSIVHTGGWQSDEMLIDQAIKHIEETSGNFFCDIITSVMHFPYNDSSYWGDYYLEEARKVHPDWSVDYQRYMSKCMDFDHGLRNLLDYLEEKGIADNTVICIYPDHRPYWMDYGTVMAYTSWINPRSGDYGIYRSPFIIYNTATEGSVCYNYCSTMDHVPTIANLFDLNYDPRLYMGTDAYNGNNTVIFANGSWLNEKGVYDASTEKFAPNDAMPEDSYIRSVNSTVQNTIKTSYLIFDENYFEDRRGICSPR